MLIVDKLEQIREYCYRGKTNPMACVVIKTSIGFDKKISFPIFGKGTLVPPQEFLKKFASHRTG